MSSFYIRKTIVEGLEGSEAELRSVKMIGNTIHELGHQNPFFSSFSLYDGVLRADVENKRNANVMAHNYENTVPVISGSAENILTTACTLLKDSLATQRYGVKSAYLEAAGGGSWVYYDGYEFTMNQIPKEQRIRLITPMAAVIFHTNNTELSNLRLENEKVDLGVYGEVTLITGALAQMHPNLMLVLGRDGELYLDFGCLMPFIGSAEKASTSKAVIAAEVAANFHDLVSSTSRIRRDGLRNISQLSPVERDNYDPITQLLVPRPGPSHQITP